MQAIIPILIMFASSLVARMMLGAGLAFFTYDWINDIVLQIQQEMSGMLYNLPSDILGLISILKIPNALSVVMSAFGVAAFIKASKVFIGKTT